MGFLENLINIGKPFDFEIASDMLKDSKFDLMTLGKAVTEVTNPQLKKLITNHLLTAIKQHHMLSDLASGKDWYKPFLNPEEQVLNDLKAADHVL
jgi:similar to spore coat protein